MILLDTCTLLWLAAEPASLSQRAREVLASHHGRLFVSAISAFEVSIKHHKGRLTLPSEPAEWFTRALEFHGLLEIPVNGRIAALSTSLPPLHTDPCDRLIVATAAIHGLTVLTPDPLIRGYPQLSSSW